MYICQGKREKEETRLDDSYVEKTTKTNKQKEGKRVVSVRGRREEGGGLTKTWHETHKKRKKFEEEMNK